MPDLSPYKTIAVASTFSPRFEQVLAEAKRIRDRFSAELRLIHVGKRNAETAKKFNDALAELNLPLSSTIHYEEGEPADAILDVLAREKIDLILAGALEKEVVLHPFLGKVARRLVREAECSVMLFPRPKVRPKPLRGIVFIADYSPQGLRALTMTLALACAESCERLYVIRVLTAFDEARASIGAKVEGRARQKSGDDEDEKLERFVLSAGATEVPVDARCIRGSTGLAALDFVQSVKADMLVVPVREEAAKRRKLPRNVAWIADVIPCNLWVIR
jgi:nucleotide-binding universal stress UspA family protein